MTLRFFGLLLLLFLLSFSALANKTRVTFIAPDPHNTQNVFWQDFISIMSKSAKDLDLDLEVLYGESNRFRTKKLITNVLSREVPPHYLVTIVNLGFIKDLLDMAEKKRVHTIIVNSDIDNNEKLEIGKPREIYKYWLGSISPNDQQAGHLLASELLKVAHKKINSPSYTMIGFTGTRDTSVSANRVNGLNNFIKNNAKKIKLQQIINGNWNGDYIQKIMPNILSRYPNTNIYWSAGGGMSLGVLEALDSQDKNIVVGEMEWSNLVLTKVVQKKIDVAVGGHFMDGAWAMVLIKDYSQGIDFKDDIGTNYQTNFHAITKQDLLAKKDYFFNKQWLKINFKKHSKFYSPDVKEYNFTLHY
jgi:ABC-type sugar transport system substrate-binding protein